MDAVISAVPATGSAPRSPRPPAAVPMAVMDQQNKEFVPYVLPVEVGTAVNFPNNDKIKHHVYSFSPAKKFELPLYTTPPEPMLFDRPGVVALGCNIHDWMVAYIVVVPTPYFTKSSAKGNWQIANVPAGDYDVQVWHPLLRSETGTVQRIAIGKTPATPVVFALDLKREVRRARPSDSTYGGERGSSSP